MATPPRGANRQVRLEVGSVGTGAGRSSFNNYGREAGEGALRLIPIRLVGVRHITIMTMAMTTLVPKADLALPVIQQHRRAPLWSTEMPS